MSASTTWTRHRPLARRLARDWHIPGHDRQDVVQEAEIALWEAATAWRPDRGANFSTFARRVIGAHLADVLRTATRDKRGNGESAVDIATLPHLHQATDATEDRERLRAVIAAIDTDLTAFERHCVVGIASGRTYLELGDPKRVDNALFKARRKLKAAA